jgi:hypothetical protein
LYIRRNEKITLRKNLRFFENGDVIVSKEEWLAGKLKKKGSKKPKNKKHILCEQQSIVAHNTAHCSAQHSAL